MKKLHLYKISLLISAIFALQSTLLQANPLAERPVLCWYMVCYFAPVEHYMEEIELAKAHGIDAFLLDVGKWKMPDKKTGELKDSNYVKATERMFEAAKRTGFKLAMTPEVYVARGGLVENTKDMLRRYHKHPNYFHYKGRPLLATYIGRPAQWGKAMTELREEDGIDPLFVGNFWNPRWAMTWSVKTAQSFFRESAELDGLINFGTMGTTMELNSNANGRYATILEDKVFIAGVNPTYNSSNVIDRRGMEGYGALWEGAIRDGADMVGIVIWNDYNEDSNLYPGRWPFGAEKQYISRDESFLDVTHYYASWFKTGVKPAITQDKLYVVYRNRTQWQDKAWNMKKQQFERIRNKQYPYDQFHDDYEDKVYVTGFMTEAAELTVTLGDKEYAYDLKAGVQTIGVPMSGGTPQFDLKRKGKSLAKVVSGKQIIFEETKENSETDGGKHKIFRNFTYGTAIGPVAKSLSARDAKLLGNAEAVRLKTGLFSKEREGVQTKAAEGSGLEWPVSGLGTATYNLRITYSNPDVNDARLTMTIDGGRSEASDQTRILPVSFPPTGKGKLASTSFLWSLFANTSAIKIDYQLGKKFKKVDPAGNDKGSVFIEKIEMIKVEPTKKPALRDFSVPEMVKIPGGSFIMGTGNGEPDEAPARKVTLSPFAIGKYEITNEQFEKFMPEHRQFRDEYSWRDREPVIYVKWTEAAGYCNWLSKQQGLEPVYDEKSWEADLSKNGYRLPSEAQWEYVSAGRDENRPYVWGKAEPAKDSCHAARARGEKPNQIPAAVPSAGFLPGVVPVGTIANDQSRDGVMDLAGNVSEWCGDWFDEYDPKARKDPLQTTKSKTGYRAIRGGSWGYYNYSLRVQDREYNTQVYPGYIYIGFRVVLPAKK